MRNAINWVVGCCLLLVCAIALAAEPPVKKSRNGICHPKGGTYYSRTKHYTPMTPCRPASTAAAGRRNADYCTEKSNPKCEIGQVKTFDVFSCAFG